MKLLSEIVVPMQRNNRSVICTGVEEPMVSVRGD